MVTRVGIQENLVEALKSLIELDYDAAEAYEAAIRRLENSGYRSKFEEFKQDHQRHTEEIRVYLRSKNEESPKEGDMKKFLTQGKVVLAGMVGDLSILKAMQSNEKDTNQAYKRMSERQDLEEEIQKIIVRGLEDEQRHFHWIQSVLEEREP